MPQVFIDASSAILLYRADLFIPCADTFSLVMAETVFREVTVQEYPGSAFFKTIKTRNMVTIKRPVQDTALSNLKGFDQMDRGERETLTLFREMSPSSSVSCGASFIIIDDGKGAKFCRNQDIPFINALLVPKIFWYSGRMTTQAYKEKTARILELGRYSGQIIETAQALTEENLKHFLRKAAVQEEAMTDKPARTQDPQVWKRKAMAFTIRSHRHLWGKNNEDPLVFLFSGVLPMNFQNRFTWAGTNSVRSALIKDGEQIRKVPFLFLPALYFPIQWTKNYNLSL